MNNDKIFKLARGFRGRSKNCITLATARVHKALQYAFASRKVKKRDFRSLWIQQINAGSRQYDLPYHEMIHGLAVADVAINRKVLAELAISEPFSFRALTKVAEESLEQKKATRATSPQQATASIPLSARVKAAAAQTRSSPSSSGSASVGAPSSATTSHPSPSTSL